MAERHFLHLDSAGLRAARVHRGQVGLTDHITAADGPPALAADGIPTRVVSMPCTEIFDAQDAAYKESVLPRSVRARIAIEAAAADYWRKYVGLDGAVVGMERFGASAPAKVLFERLGFTVAHVLELAEELLQQGK